MKRSSKSRFFLIFFLFFLSFRPALAQEDKWIFLPNSTLFQNLVGDLREPQTGLVAYTTQNRYEGEVGATVELLRYLPSNGFQWAWGIFGEGFILLDEYGATFPMRDGDWYAGMYVSEKSGDFSHRLEFEHESSHLGDSLQGLQTPTFFSRENLNFTSSWQPNDALRLHVGIGYWENMAPSGGPLFLSWGGEVYSPSTDILDGPLRGYSTLHFDWKQEYSDVLYVTWEAGVQWKFKKGETRDVRVALIYYDGNSEFGQFASTHDEHWGLGVYFDP